MKSSIQHHAFGLFCVWALLRHDLTLHGNTGLTSAADCPADIEFIEELTGYIHWTVEPPETDCDVFRNWIVNVPPSHGVFVYVQHIDLRGEKTLVRLVRLIPQDDGVNEEEVHIWREKDHTFRMTSVVGGVKLQAVALEPFIDFGSSFNITFAVYNKSSLPKELPPQVWGSKRSLFNCSQTIPIPESIACDGITHCADKEDEVGCDHRLQGCDHWMPYHNSCLKVFAFPSDAYDYSALLLTDHCQSLDKQATLASLPDEDGVGVAVDMVYKAGLSFAVVDLHKVEPMSTKNGNLYRFIWQWGPKGSPIAYQETEQLKWSGSGFDCVMIALFPSIRLLPYSCSLTDFDKHSVGFVCMKPKGNAPSPDKKHNVGVHLRKTEGMDGRLITKQCEDGSLVQPFHQCAWQGHTMSSAWSPHSFTLFPCGCGPPVHYSLLCDGVEDCVDGSDESTCPSPQSVRKHEAVFMCRNLQAYLQQWQCDGLVHCLDGTDEELCTVCQMARCQGVGCVPFPNAQYFDECDLDIESVGSATEVRFSLVPMVRSLYLDGYGMSRLKLVAYNDTGYFKCTNGLHIPTFLLNNLESDCPLGEDENIPPGNFTCPGLYRCQYSGQCLHPDLGCDGVPHCPNKDDENYCYLSRPPDCTCEGFACSCSRLPSPLSDVWYLRYLDLSCVTSLDNTSELADLDLLQFLNVSFCELTVVYLRDMPQLKVLDLSYNWMSGLPLQIIENLPGLTHLNISGNALLYLQDAYFPHFISKGGFVNLQHLIMADTELHRLQSFTLSSLTQLVSLDISGNSLENYDSNVFWGLRSLQALHTDDPRLCCPYFHSTLVECHAPVDELSSCTDLLRLDAFRVFLWSFSLLTILGNCGVLVYRLVTKEPKKSSSYNVLVCHLCVADLLMGVYMMIIGVADAQLRGHYVAQEKQWRQSRACLAAGVLAFISSEVSAFMICLITLDRLLKLCFPFKPHLHMSAASYLKLGCLAWGVGVLLAAGPLMGQLQFYGESSLCLPLPITRHWFSGQTYAFLVFIVLNFLIFLFIGLGQMAIYYSLVKAKAAVKSKRQEEDSAVARRLFLVVFTDFCCWFPVGLMGLLAFCGLPIPGVVTVWVAVFVLPINSALNPFLYTLNALREKWMKKKMEQKSKKTLLNLREEFPKLSAEIADELVLIYARSNRGVGLKKSLEFFSSSMGSETGTATQESIV